jgi:hypothetical protein
LQRSLVAAATFCAVVATAGCGLGPGESSEGTASISITRAYGTEQLADATVSDPSASETVLRALDANADITTRYGGGFVQSINGTEGSDAGGRVTDWFFFVNGIESSTGAAEVKVHVGDRIWWDYRDWTNALRTPAVVGSWPEPFLQASAGADRLPVEVVCFGSRPPCETAAERLSDAGVSAQVTTPAQSDGASAVRMLVGTWDDVRKDELASTIDDGPGASGVFAKFEQSDGGWRLDALNDHGDVRLEYDDEAGLVAALRDGDDPPTWVVAGADAGGLDQALLALSDDVLNNRYAVAVSSGPNTPVPVQ